MSVVKMNLAKTTSFYESFLRTDPSIRIKDTLCHCEIFFRLLLDRVPQIQSIQTFRVSTSQRRLYLDGLIHQVRGRLATS